MTDDSDMNCPKCQLPMKTEPSGDNQISRCGHCSGTWVGGDSLHDFLHAHSEAPDIEAVFEEIMELEFRPGSRQCPECPNLRLKAVDVDNVELDFCTSCKGVFFDPGELESVFPASRMPAPGADGEAAGMLDDLVGSIRAWFSGKD